MKEQPVTRAPRFFQNRKQAVSEVSIVSSDPCISLRKQAVSGVSIVSSDPCISLQAQKIQQPDYGRHSIAWIEPGASSASNPQMPQLEASLVGGSSLSGLEIQWKLEVKYHRANGSRASRDQSEDTITIPSQGYITKPENEAWKIYDEASWSDEVANRGFFGGEATLTMNLGGQGETKVYFRIGGKSPPA